jgi:cobalt/nickel transport system ATP-binding protein
MLFELNEVGYRYSDGTPALEGVSFGVEEGESLAILGANGSGKSTLLRLLNGLHFPSEGEIRFRGDVLSESGLQDAAFRQEFRQSVGFVFQNADAQLFNATVYDEVAFGPAQLGLTAADVRSRAEETLSFLGIEHLADRPPFRLSGGEKRKVAIASVLSMNPQVLLFDEPFLALDPRGQGWLARTIRDLQAAGKSTVVATHTMDMVPVIARKALILTEAHRLVFSGSVFDALADRDLLLSANLVAEPAEAPV